MSIEFNGVDQWLDGTIPTGITGPFSFFCYAKPTGSIAATSGVCGLMEDSTPATEASILRFVTSTSKATHYIRNGGTVRYEEKTSGWAANTWKQYVCINVSNSDRDLWVDGAINNIASGTHPTITPSGWNYMSIGKFFDVYQYFYGQVAEFAVWNAVLTTGDIAALNAGSIPSSIQPGALLGYWPLYNNGVNAVDPGNGDFTAYGSPSWNTTDHPIEVSVPPVFSDPGISTREETIVAYEASDWFSSSLPMTFTPITEGTGDLPAGLAMDAAGAITGTVGTGQLGAFECTITASNGVDPDTTAVFDWTITQWVIVFEGTTRLRSLDGTDYSGTVNVTAFDGTVVAGNLANPQHWTGLTVTAGALTLTGVDTTGGSNKTVLVEGVTDPNHLGAYLETAE